MPDYCYTIYTNIYGKWFEDTLKCWISKDINNQPIYTVYINNKIITGIYGGLKIIKKYKTSLPIVVIDEFMNADDLTDYESSSDDEYDTDEEEVEVEEEDYDYWITVHLFLLYKKMKSFITIVCII